MTQDDPRKQDGRAIVEALSAFEDMPEREQPPEQERDWASFDGVTEELTQAERRSRIELAADSLAGDDGRE